MVATGFGFFSKGVFGLTPHGDSWTALWMARELPWWQPLVDPHAAGYVFVLFFEPLYVLLHAPDLVLISIVGTAATQVVAFVALTGCALLVAWMARGASHSSLIGVAAAALFLFNPAAWYALADSAYRHYPVATLLALISLRPAWSWFTNHRPIGPLDTWVSAVAYFLALCAKESVAAVPGLALVLLLLGGRSARSSLGFVLPQALALVGFLAWRTFIIGGLGGHPGQNSVAPANFLTDVLASAETLWGSAWVALGLAVIAFWLRPRNAAVWLATWLAVLAPFAMTFPIDVSAGGVGKLLLGIALFLLVFAHSLMPALKKPVGVAIVLAVSAVLLVLQVRNTPDTSSLPFATSPTPSSPQQGVLIADGLTFLDVLWEHQFRVGPKQPALIFASSQDWEIYRALAAGERPNLEGAQSQEPRLTLRPLGDGRISMTAGRRGMISICVEDGSQNVRIGGLYRNGLTEFFVSSPLPPGCMSGIPSYSIEWFYVVFQDSDSEWAVRRWDSPVFRNPYPPE